MNPYLHILSIYFSVIILKTSATLQACANAPLALYGGSESYISLMLPIVELFSISSKNVFLVFCINLFNSFLYSSLSSLTLVFFIKFFPFRNTPSRHMNTVGHMAYVQFFRKISFPNWCEHPARYIFMQQADTIYLLTGLAGKD